ncbi:MAG: MMPL family transporter [Planctomycetes bacterium]|jgi:hypothetical protein|nr:MMPL family transporter [Planctomycetota bacterium]
MRSSSSLLRRGAWFLFAAATVLMLVGLVRQQVDPQNRALKAPDSADAAALAALGEVVALDPVLLLAFVTRGDLPLLSGDQQRLEQLRTELGRRPDVVQVFDAPVPDPGLELMPVAIRGDNLLETAEAVVAAARAAAPPTVEVRATGLPLLEGTIARLVAGERTTIVPVLVAVLLLAALLFYRHLGLAIAVLLPALCGIAWTGGTIAWLGHRLDPIAALLDPVLLTIGVAASIHFVEAYRRALANGLAPHAAGRAAAVELRTPALLACATTMIGLWSLCTSAIPAVFDFGVRSALGVAVVHLLTFVLLPSWLPFAASAAAAAEVATGRGRRWLGFLRAHRCQLGLVVGALTALAAAGLLRLQTDNDPLQMLPADEPARVDHDLLATRLGGVEVFHLLIAERSVAGEPSRLLPFLAELQRTPGIAGLAGPVQRSNEGALAVPLLLAPGGSGVRAPLFDRIERSACVLGLDGLVVAGASVQIARDSHRLLLSLLGSLGLSGLLLSLGMMIGLRSVRLGLLGMLPNLLPSLWLYGALGWSDRPLSVATAMIGCTMLGLIVDNTLHLLHHYRHERSTASPRLALRAAFDRCGRAMTLASVVLMLGFATAATSRLETTVEFALLATATIAAAWFATAVVLPMLITGLRPRGRSGGTNHAQ